SVFMLGSRTDRTQTNPTRFAVLENHRPAVSAAKTRSDATPDRTIHFRAFDSVIAKTATLETSIGASNTRKNTPSSTTYGRTDGPSQPGMSKMAAAWISTIADRKSTRLNSSHGSISYAVFCLK